MDKKIKEKQKSRFKTNENIDKERKIMKRN